MRPSVRKLLSAVRLQIGTLRTKPQTTKPAQQPPHTSWPTYTTMSSTIDSISSVRYINIMLHFCKLRIIGKGMDVAAQYLELNVGGRVGGLCGGKI
jgi:hypothetical protein